MITLTHEEKTSPAWRKVGAWAGEQLAVLRNDLEKDLPLEKTQVLRGKIRALNSLLALATPALTVIAEEDAE